MDDILVQKWDLWDGTIDCNASGKIWNSLIMNELSQELTDQFRDLGILEKNIVTLIMKNTILLPLSLIALLRNRTNVFILHESQTIDELESNFKQIRSGWIISDSNFSKSVEKKIKMYKVLEKQFCNLTLYVYKLDLNCDKLEYEGYLLFPTSGTYNKKAICVRSQNSVVADAENYISTIGGFDQIRINVTTPLSHMYGFGFGLLSSILSNSSIVIAPIFNPKILFQRELENLSDLIIITPSILKSLILLKSYNSQFRLPKRIFYAGAHCNRELKNETEKVFDGSVYCIYGATEVGGITTTCFKSKKDTDKGVGYPLNNVDLKIINKQNYIDLGRDIGEIAVASSAQMHSYYKNPQIEKYINTHDLGFLDEFGNLHLVGRNKDIINVNGIKVDPYEIEAVILKYPGIHECVVYPGELGSGEEKIFAAITLKNTTITIENIKAFCSQKLPLYKVPVKIFILKNIPKTPTGKIKKVELLHYKKNRGIGT